MQLKEQFDKKMIIPYIMVGDGGIDKSYELLKLYVSLGCSVIEIGVPFSDPAADGKTIQEAGIRSLKNNTTISDCLTFVEKGTKKYPQVSFVLMTYLNPILNYGIELFFKTALIDGIIIPDLPIEEYDILLDLAISNDIAIIPLITIDTSLERMKDILKCSDGFVYLITLKGITGSKSAQMHDTLTALEKLQSITDLPIVAGFGIKTREQVTTFLERFDAVVIASQLITYVNQKKYESIKELLELKKTPIK